LSAPRLATALGPAHHQSAAWALAGSAATFKSGQPVPYRGHGELLQFYNPGRMLTIEIPIQRLSPGRLNILVAEDHNGYPGTVLESFPGVLAPMIGDTNFLVLHSTLQPKLLGGAKYWLCAEPQDADTMALWFYSVDLPRIRHAVAHSPSNWTPIEQQFAATNAPELWDVPNKIRKTGAYFARIMVSQPAYPLPAQAMPPKIAAKGP
jgi:hypothetical protein